MGTRIDLKTTLFYHLTPLAKLPRNRSEFDYAALDAAAQVSNAVIEREVFARVDESLVLFSPAVHWREANEQNKSESLKSVLPILYSGNGLEIHLGHEYGLLTCDFI